MDIQLNFINQSNDSQAPLIVVFAKNTAAAADARVVAWKVIRNCDVGENHPFAYPLDLMVSTNDGDGNFMPRMKAEPGQLFEVRPDLSGQRLAPVGLASSPREIQVRNGLPAARLGVNVYKDGRLFATRQGLGPGEQAAFSFEPHLWIGTASQVRQGEAIDPATLSEIQAQLPMEGILAADIVMTGGGPGMGSQPFQFALHNVERA